MEALNNALNNIKCEFVNYIKDKYISSKYFIETCNGLNFKKFDKLELIFLLNIDYLTLSAKQIKQINNRNFKNIFETNTGSFEKINDLVLNTNTKHSITTPINIIHNTNTTTNITTPPDNDGWVETSF